MPAGSPSAAELTAAIKAEALRLGFDLVGAAPAVVPPTLAEFQRWLADGFCGQMRYLSERTEAYRHPRHLLEGARSVLMLGINYRTVEPIPAGLGQGSVSRYAWGRDYHDVVRQRLHQLADFHRRVVPQAQVRGVVDTAPLLERQFGQLAGLGWIGKNTALIHERLGSWFLLAALLTSEELVYDGPVEDRCGPCRACLDACPTGALVAPYRLDARRCISYLTIELRGAIPRDLRAAVGERLFGCDSCQDACPWNRRTPAGTVEDFLPGPGMNPCDLVELMRADAPALRQRFRGTPLGRAKRAGLLRNAAVVLGNRPIPAALPALLWGLTDAEPTIRAACAWALGRYRDPAAGQALRERSAVETDSEVRGEIDRSLGTAQP